MGSSLFFEEDLPKNVRSKYEAVVVAGLRARELQKGVKSLVDVESRKYTTVALHELLADKLFFERGEPRKQIEIPDQEPLS